MMASSNFFDLYYLSPMLIIGVAILILLVLLLVCHVDAHLCASFSICSLFIALLFTLLLGAQLNRSAIKKTALPEKHLLLSAPVTTEKNSIHGNKVDAKQIALNEKNRLTDKEKNQNSASQPLITSSIILSAINVGKGLTSQENSKTPFTGEIRYKQPGSIHKKHVWQPTYITALFTSDAYALLYTGLIIIISIVTASFASSWFKTHNINQGLFYLLLLFSVLGGIILVYSSHLISLFIGIELLSVPLIGLIGFQYTQNNSIEATIKYMILSAVATGFLLLGIAFYYAATCERTFSGLSFQLSTQPEPSALLLTGVCLMLVGIGFKLSLVPFQLWLPDVFQGAPTAVSLFLSTVGKLSVFCAIARLFLLAPIVNNDSIQFIVAIMAFTSILFGNCFALMQENIKRLVAYASITNYGYLFVALIAVQYQVLALETIGIYLISYVLSNICVFGAINLESSAIQTRDRDSVMDLRGLFWRKPVVATTMAMGLLSLAGIPLTIGFMGRFLLLLLSVTAQLWWLVAAIVIGSVFGLYFYLRLIINLYLRPATKENSLKSIIEPCQRFHVRMLNMNEIILVVSAFAILLCGIYPQLLLSLVSSARYLIP